MVGVGLEARQSLTDDLVGDALHALAGDSETPGDHRALSRPVAAIHPEHEGLEDLMDSVPREIGNSATDYLPSLRCFLLYFEDEVAAIPGEGKWKSPLCKRVDPFCNVPQIVGCAGWC